MSNKPEPYIYKATIERVGDGDTIDVTLDLGFDVRLHKQRCRLAGIDTPESRTRDLAEKKIRFRCQRKIKTTMYRIYNYKIIWKG